jgi:hypothetical protein
VREAVLRDGKNQTTDGTDNTDNFSCNIRVIRAIRGLIHEQLVWAGF